MRKQHLLAGTLVLVSLFFCSAGIERKAGATTLSSAPISSTMPEEWSHPAGFKFWLPDNWKTKEDGDMLVANGPGEAEIYFFVPKNAKSFDNALDEVDEELSGWLKGIKFDKPSASNIGGIKEAFISGTGKDRKSGDPMEFGLGIYEKNGKILMVFGATPTENFEKFHKVFQKVVDSIK